MVAVKYSSKLCPRNLSFCAYDISMACVFGELKLENNNFHFEVTVTQLSLRMDNP
jgi:hypothetical protein